MKDCPKPTLFALAYPVAWEGRGSVIVGGGHGIRIIDIIPCAVRPRRCIVLKPVQTQRLQDILRNDQHREQSDAINSQRKSSGGVGGLRDRGLVESHVDAD